MITIGRRFVLGAIAPSVSSLRVARFASLGSIASTEVSFAALGPTIMTWSAGESSSTVGSVTTI